MQVMGLLIPAGRMNLPALATSVCSTFLALHLPLPHLRARQIKHTQRGTEEEELGLC